MTCLIRGLIQHPLCVVHLIIYIFRSVFFIICELGGAAHYYTIVRHAYHRQHTSSAVYLYAKIATLGPCLCNVWILSVRQNLRGRAVFVRCMERDGNEPLLPSG